MVSSTLYRWGNRVSDRMSEPPRGTMLVWFRGLEPWQLSYRTLTHQPLCHCAQLCPALWDPMGWSPPGSSVHGIFQVRILEWVATSFPRGSSQPRDGTQDFCIGRRILYHWATREDQTASHFKAIPSLPHPPESSPWALLLQAEGSRGGDGGVIGSGVLILLWPLPLTLRLGRGWGRRGEPEPLAGKSIRPPLPAPEAVDHYSEDESPATEFSPVSSIIHSRHPRHRVALGSGRNYSRGPALRGFYPQLSLTTSNLILSIWGLGTFNPEGLETPAQAKRPATRWPTGHLGLCLSPALPLSSYLLGASISLSVKWEAPLH